MIDGQAELTKLGRRIKQLRLEKGLTQLDLAEAIDQPEEYIAGIEAGNCNLYLVEIVLLARKLDIKVSGLFPQ